MKKRRVWRYTCDYCGKSGCAAGHMKAHEPHCTLNPQRECRACKTGGRTPAPLAEIVAHVRTAPLMFKDAKEREEWTASTLDLADGCPVCTLAAIRLADRCKPKFERRTEGEWAVSDMVREPFSFDLKAAMKAFWQDVNADDASNLY